MLGIRFAVLAAALLMSGGVSGQDYPSKLIRIFTSGVGSGSDSEARLIAQGIAGPLGQPVIVENRASGVTSAEIVAKAPADGYTIFSWGNTLWVGALLQETPYDPIRDFAPITLVGRAPSILVVHPSLPVKSVKALIELARAKPGMLNYGTGSLGSPNHLGAELFNAMANVNIVRVNYRGSGPAVTALLGGEVQLMFANVASVSSHLKSHKLLALAVTSAQPSTLVPGLPTLAASGLPGYEISSGDAVLGPAKMPPAVINRLNQEIVRFLKTPPAREQLFAAGIEVVGSSPEDLASAIKTETATMGKLIKDKGIKAN